MSTFLSLKVNLYFLFGIYSIDFDAIHESVIFSRLTDSMDNQKSQSLAILVEILSFFSFFPDFQFSFRDLKKLIYFKSETVK